jgi:MFS transporter, FSR family, fosmidomycin resistance protein
MTQAVLSAPGSSRTRVLGAISVAHFVSHYYILLLAPLLPFVRADYGVSYTEIGFALVAFNVISAALQTPAGFLVDRFGGRLLLTAGLIIGAAAFVLAGVVHSFWFLVAMFALAGVGNTVYHPADYALLSQHISAQRIGQAFSVHTFAGMLGSAAAPPALLLMQEIWGWRTAFVVSGLVGLLVAVVVAVMPEASDSTTKKAGAADDSKPDWYVLLSPPILLNLFFFMLLAMITAGLYNYSVVALNDLYSTPLATGNAGLTAFLLASSGGVLIGGLLVGRTSRHALVATLCLIATAAFVLLVGLVDVGELVLVVALALAGLFSGVMMPSRDMIVRAVTPPGSFGKVFGFVTSGFNLGGIVAPLVFGPIMDHGSPRLVFLAVAALCLISMATVVGRMRG